MLSSFLESFTTTLAIGIGARIGRKLPGIVSKILKGFAFILSAVMWLTAAQPGGVFDLFASTGVRIITILYCIIVWGGIVGLAVLKYKKGFNGLELYYWVILILSIIVEIINIGEFSVLSVIFGVIGGYFLTPLPVFMNVVADSVVTKKKQKQNKR